MGVQNVRRGLYFSDWKLIKVSLQLLNFCFVRVFIVCNVIFIKELYIFCRFEIFKVLCKNISNLYYFYEKGCLKMFIYVC